MSQRKTALRRHATAQATDTVKFKGLDWFAGLFGVEEKNHEYLQERLKYDPENNSLECPHGRRFQVGPFSTPTVQELCEQVGKVDRSSLPPGSLRVIHTMVEDVLVMHSEAIMYKATFQVASQFNCLEFPSSMNIPEHGIKEYVDDGTQGPACSLAAAPGTLYRNYFVPVEPGDRVLGQRKRHQLNNLAGVQELLQKEFGEEFLKVSNGYTRFKIGDLKKLKQRLREEPEVEDRIVNNLRVGVQRNTQVVFKGRAPEKDLMFALPRGGEPQLVTQVFCSAMSLSETLQDAAEGIAPLILRGCYRATLAQALLSAIENNWEHNSHKVVLTFVGGGAFGNRQEWINDAIARACADFAQFPLEVYIAHYRAISKATADDINRRIMSHAKEWKAPFIQISQGRYADVGTPSHARASRTQSGPAPDTPSAPSRDRAKPVSRTLSAPAQKTHRTSQLARKMDVAADHESRSIDTDDREDGDGNDGGDGGGERGALRDGHTADATQATQPKRNKMIE